MGPLKLSARPRPFLIIAMLSLVTSICGCERPEGNSLVIATPWSLVDRSAVDEAFTKSYPQASPIVWIPLLPGDDPVRLVPKLGVDLVLGLPESVCDHLVLNQSLLSVDKSEPRYYRIVRRSSLGISSNGISLVDTSLRSRRLAGKVAIDDPRHDAISLAWGFDRFKAKAYGDLVRSAANAARVGRGNSALTEVLRGEILAAPTTGIEGPIDDHSTFTKIENAQPWREGVGLVARTPHEKEARLFLAFLAQEGQSEHYPTDERTREDLSLFEDLLGSCLIDANDELKDAVLALERAGNPAELEAYLDDPPPWPPTSITKIRQRTDHEALLETLASEITESSEARFRLLESWDHAPKKLDLVQLQTLSTLSRGHLLNESRFRMWLRAEWTAWARQHYRRIAREAGKVTS